MSRWTDVEVTEVIKESDDAFLFEIDGEEYWIPKSQIHRDASLSEGDENITVEITTWIADQKGLS